MSVRDTIDVQYAWASPPLACCNEWLPLSVNVFNGQTGVWRWRDHCEQPAHPTRSAARLTTKALPAIPHPHAPHPYPTLPAPRPNLSLRGSPACKSLPHTLQMHTLPTAPHLTCTGPAPPLLRSGPPRETTAQRRCRSAPKTAVPTGPPPPSPPPLQPLPLTPAPHLRPYPCGGVQAGVEVVPVSRQLPGRYCPPIRRPCGTHPGLRVWLCAARTADSPLRKWKVWCTSELQLRCEFKLLLGYRIRGWRCAA